MTPESFPYLSSREEPTVTGIELIGYPCVFLLSRKLLEPPVKNEKFVGNDK